MNLPLAKSMCWLLVALVVLTPSGVCLAQATASQPQWIWAAQHRKDQIPETSCYFRKSINIARMTGAQIMITADDQYELWINGDKVADGNNWQNRQTFNITPYLEIGDNVFAVAVHNTQGRSAGLLAEITILGPNGESVRFPTNATWKTELRPWPLWQSKLYRDSGWDRAQMLGPANATAPWIVSEPKVAAKAAPTAAANRSALPPVAVASSKPNQRAVPAQTASTGGGAEEASTSETATAEEDSRFRILSGFSIQEVISAEKTGALISMTFNEFGNILAAKEGGPLLLLYDSNEDGVVDSSRVYNDTVKNIQGILPLNGDVFVVGEGTDGTALYRLSDTDGDGRVEEVATLVTFQGAIGEHGPHGLALGPDGLIYLVAGNDTKLATKASENSPLRHFYEGDLVPRFEDPGGHAVGVKAPGGIVLRTDVEGKTVEVVAGGIRNAYDLAFNRDGELFTHDSDMEWDEGLVWHLPTRILRVSPGADFGWRSGWAKWPTYYPDCVPPVLETGAGSPTGLVVYDHYKFPAKFHNRLFVTDWANGRISTVTLEQDGAGYKAKSEPLLEGTPMNVTDLGIGPDGWVYFTTGGRGTEGGLYRIVWKGDEPEGFDNLGEGIAKAIRHPQPQSAWGRQRIAEIQSDLGDKWAPQIQGVAIAAENPSYYRTRALDLMQLYGPTPSFSMLKELTGDKDPQVAQKAVSLFINYPGEEATQRLRELLTHDNAGVRREVCETLIEINGRVPFDELRPLLEAEDRREAYAARRLLERQPLEGWIDAALASDSVSLFNAASLAALVAYPSHDLGMKVIARSQEHLDGFLTDTQFLSLVRVIQLAIHRGELKSEELPELAHRLGEEFPAGNHLLNRELIRLLAWFPVSDITDRYIAHLDSELPQSERLNLAMHLSYIREGWTTEQKLKLLGHLEQGLTIDGGEGLRGYIETSTKQFVKCLTPEEQYVALTMGHMWPNAALAVLFELPEHPADNVLAVLRMIDTELVGDDSAVAERMRKGIVAMLAQNGTPENMSYLRMAFDREPERRASIAFGLAQQPSGENFPLLVKALPVLDGNFGTAVVQKMATATETSEDPEAIRQLILFGLRSDEAGQKAAAALLTKWCGDHGAKTSSGAANPMEAWQDWFAIQFPELPEAKLVDKKSSNWDLDELLEFLASEDFAGGNVDHGAQLFKSTQCAACHRFGGLGEAIGPDLTDIARRFQKKQILESILFPSHVISDQYATQQILTLDGKVYSGLVSTTPQGVYVVIDSNGEKTEIPHDQIDEIAPSKTSVMPSGLIDHLTAQEVGDLMTFLKASKEKSPSRIADKAEGKTIR